VIKELDLYINCGHQKLHRSDVKKNSRLPLISSQKPLTFFKVDSN
jgi:hypothetical protein